MLSDKVPYYILDLLQQAPSVYVEGLGRFEAIFHPALIDLPNSRIKPPYVEPDFKDNPEAPNETLANYIRYVSGTEIGSPEKSIAEFVSNVHENTTDGKTYLIEKFGFEPKYAFNEKEDVVGVFKTFSDIDFSKYKKKSG